MMGHIHIILKDLIDVNFGADKWAVILKEAGLSDDKTCLDTVQQPDETSYSLVHATCAVLGISADDALEAFGKHFVVFALKSGNSRFLKAQGMTLQAFLANVNNLHGQLERDHPNAIFPYIEAKYDPVKDEVDLEYLSTRKGLSKVVSGVVKEIGRRLYGLEVTMEETESVAYEDDIKDGRGAAWRVSWKPLPGGPVLLETASDMQSTTTKMSFAALHTAMIDFGKLLGNIECWAPLACDATGITGVRPQIVQKLEELEIAVKPEDVLLRSAKAKRIAAAWCDPSLEECRSFWRSSDGMAGDYAISQDAIQVDVFVSHTWSPPENWALIMGSDVDYAEVKSTTLAVMAKDVAQVQGSVEEWGEVTFWVDKACIPQDSEQLKSACINLLEKFIQKCEFMCVVFTWTYLDRLWCVYEWACVLVHKEPSKVFMQTELFVKEETLPLYIETVRYFALGRTKCFIESDRAILKAKIRDEYVSEEAFEKLVQATAIALMARSMAFRAGRSAEMHKRFFIPWVQLANDLGMCDLANALGRSNSGQWRKASWSLAESCSPRMTKMLTDVSPCSSSSPLVKANKSMPAGKAFFRDSDSDQSPLTPVQLQRVSSMPAVKKKYSEGRKAPKAASTMSPTLLTQLGSCMGINAAKYQRSVDEWFDQDVAPILREIRLQSVKV
eukprot:TRINITY_DN25630_c0_g1_i1.p1 TRINITY_DN25630_c0_g1~~TRINITY_DN25630_c0_g1_i1.p1  ORF type:complete len:670 (+),score=152.96 TRINITY_DN25630_c0_g1_i1:132-2141(+)